MKILVADDNKLIRDQLKTSLEAESFAVDTAADGEEASYIGRVNEYDAIILDLIMPKKDGRDVCREIRAAGKKAPILALSVNGTIEEKVSMLNCGADDYVTKPFSFKEPHARLHALRRRPQALESNIYEADDLTLDTRTQKVCRGQREIYLTRKEFSLLEFLLKNKGAVVTRGMIMEHVWNAESDPFSNTIEAHILNIRRKIQAPKCPALIQTVPGRGYKIEAGSNLLYGKRRSNRNHHILGNS
jgi:DNA-binding response OmpR family regulator